MIFCGTLWAAEGYDIPQLIPTAEVYSFSGPGEGDLLDTADLVNLGVAYRDGIGVPQNYGRARELFRKAAMRGDANAQDALADMLAYGQGGLKDPVEAFAWYTLALYQDQLGVREKLDDLRFMLRREQILDGEARALELASEIRGQSGRGKDGSDGSTLSAPSMPHLATGKEEKALNRALDAYDAQDFNTAFVVFRSLAQKGVVRAQAYMGILFERGQGVKSDLEVARAWYQKAADQGDVLAINNLATLYQEGTSATPQDYRRALDLYRTAALNGYGPSQVKLGTIYADGRSGARDLVEAYAWFTLAARQGIAEGQRGLEAIRRQLTANQLSLGQRRVEEYRREISALKGEGYAGNGGNRIKDGSDGFTRVPTPSRTRITALENQTLNRGLNAFANRNYATAYQILLPLAKRGDSRAQAFVGTMLNDGLGVEKNQGLARQWYERARFRGDFLAINNLGVLYRDGSRDIPRNYVKAIELFKEGAMMGDDQSQNNLGGMYLQGQGVPVNPVEAYAWFSLSAVQGNVSAQKNLDLVRQQLSIDQVRAGSRRAEELGRIIAGK